MEKNSTDESNLENPGGIPLSNVIICVFNIPISIVSILGNALVLAAILRTTSLHSPATLLLANLALTDLAVGLLSEPLLVFNYLVKWRPSFAAVYPITQQVFNITGYFLCSASILTVTAVSLDRMLALKYHLRYNSLVTFERTVLVIAAIWIVSGFISSMILWKSSVFYPSIAVLIIGCLITTFVAYFSIFRIVRRHQAQIHAQMQVAAANNENYSRFRRLRKSVVSTFYVYCLFLFCYLPYLAIVIISLSTSVNIGYGWAVTSTVVYLNSALNPLLYLWRLPEIRQAVKQIMFLNN